MKQLLQLFFFVSLLIALMLGGCKSSKEAAEKQEAPPPVKSGEQMPGTTEQSPTKKVDTVSVDVRNAQKPSYEAPSTLAPLPAGKFSVQVGAYTMPDNADRIAAIAKERFRLSVYTIQDKKDNLYKVLIGDFATKDEARSFRDEMVQKYPGDYKDAWVSENPQP